MFLSRSKPVEYTKQKEAILLFFGRLIKNLFVGFNDNLDGLRRFKNMGAISIKIDDTYPSTSGRIRKFVAQIGRFA